MNTIDANVSDSSNPSADWMDRMLRHDAALHADDYIDDSGFTARVMQTLPVVGALPAWRRPAIAALWVIAGVLLAVALPGVAFDFARAAYKPVSYTHLTLPTICSV